MDAKTSKPVTAITAGAYSVPPPRLVDMAQQLRSSYASAEPFPHTVIDNLFPEELLDAVLAEFPRHDQIEWQQFDNGNEKKYALKGETQLGNVSRHLLWELNSQVFIMFLQE